MKQLTEYRVIDVPHKQWRCKECGWVDQKDTYACEACGDRFCECQAGELMMDEEGLYFCPTCVKGMKEEHGTR